jgi:hypothetical protein
MIKKFTIKIEIPGQGKIWEVVAEGARVETAIVRALRQWRKEEWKSRPLPAVNIQAQAHIGR